MRKFFRNRYWIVSAGSAAAGMYGFPYPFECLLEHDAGTAESDVDWDAELRALLDSGKPCIGRGDL